MANHCWREMVNFFACDELLISSGTPVPRIGMMWTGWESTRTSASWSIAASPNSSPTCVKVWCMWKIGRCFPGRVGSGPLARCASVDIDQAGRRTKCPGTAPKTPSPVIQIVRGCSCTILTKMPKAPTFRLLLSHLRPFYAGTTRRCTRGTGSATSHSAPRDKKPVHRLGL
jgi:hypothetical protein